MKRFRFLVTLGLVLFLLVTPAFAAGVNLNVNGKDLKTTLTLENGSVMLPLETTVDILGAELSWTNEKTFTINENGNTLTMTIGEKSALFNDQETWANLAPAKKDQAVLIPLRFVQEKFGAKVKWQKETRTAAVVYKELRDNLSPMEMLLKSSQLSQKYNTYKMDGRMDMNIDMKVNGAPPEENIPMKMAANIEGILQTEPMEVYIKQAMEFPGMPEDDQAQFPGGTPTVETYMTENAMFIKMPGIGWIKQDLPFSPDFIKEQKNIQSDPLLAAEQMEQFGIILNYRNDQQVNGKQYYVISANIDPEKFMEGYRQIMEQVMPTLPETTENSSPQDLETTMKDFFNNSKINCQYAVLINKETLLMDRINLDMDLEMRLENMVEGNSEKVWMKINASGFYNVFDYGAKFNRPDVSEAKEMPLTQEMPLTPVQDTVPENN